MDGTGYRRVFVHMVEDELSLSALGASSKLNTEHEFLDMLFAKGRQATEHWLAAHFDAIGERSTVNIRDLFQGDEDALDGQRITRDARFRQRESQAE